MSKRTPKIIEILGRHRGTGTCRMTDENLKHLHVLLFMALLQASEEVLRRGIGEGKEQLCIRIANPNQLCE